MHASVPGFGMNCSAASVRRMAAAMMICSCAWAETLVGLQNWSACQPALRTLSCTLLSCQQYCLQERKAIGKEGLKLDRKTGADLTPAVWDQFYRFYRNTTGACSSCSCLRSMIHLTCSRAPRSCTCAPCLPAFLRHAHSHKQIC